MNKKIPRKLLDDYNREQQDTIDFINSRPGLGQALAGFSVRQAGQLLSNDEDDDASFTGLMLRIASHQLINWIIDGTITCD